MSVVLTFLKAKNSKECDLFMGTFSGPGTPISEWDILNRDKDIKTKGIILKVLEYEDAKTLPTEYIKSVNTSPCFVLKNGDDMSSLLFYPYRAPKKAKDIKNWAISYTERLSNITDVKVPVTSTPTATTSTTTLNIQKPPTAYTIGMSTLVVAVAIAAGAAGGAALAEMNKNKDSCGHPDHNGLLIHESTQDPDYWGETIKNDSQKINSLHSQSEELIEDDL